MTDAAAHRPTVGIYGYCASAADTFGGVESHLSHLARALVAAGWRVVVHCLSAPGAGWHVADGEFRVGPRTREVSADLVEFVPAHGPGLTGAVAENVAASVRYAEQTILVFGTRDGWVFDVALAAAEELGLPAVSLVYFTAEERWYRAQFTSRSRSIAGLADAIERAALDTRGVATLRDVIERSALVVVPTDYVKGQLAALVEPPDATRIVTVYHGVDPELFARRDRPWGPDGAWLHVSRLSVPFAAHKNVAWSCEFLRAMVDLDPPPRLTICGSGDATGLVGDFATQNGLDARVTVGGFMDQPRLAAQMRVASLLLVPSMMEAGCTVIVEAVLSGCLPLVLDHAGSGEVMRSLGLGAFLVTPSTRDLGGGARTVVPEISHAREVVEFAYAHPEQVRRLLDAAADIAGQRFGIDATTRLLCEHLRRRNLLDVDTERAVRQ